MSMPSGLRMLVTVVLAAAFAGSLSGCIWVGERNRGSRTQSVHSGRHKHSHCHRKPNGKQVCHPHMHSHPHH